MFMCAENEWAVAWKCKRKPMEEESKRMEGKLERKRKVMVKEEMGQTNIVNQSSINYK